MLDKNSKFLPYPAFTAKYDLNCNFLEYYGLISAIRSIKDTSESVATLKKTATVTEVKRVFQNNI